jgi:hypothetical protein
MPSLGSGCRTQPTDGGFTLQADGVSPAIVAGLVPPDAVRSGLVRVGIAGVNRDGRVRPTIVSALPTEIAVLGPVR